MLLVHAIYHDAKPMSCQLEVPAWLAGPAMLPALIQAKRRPSGNLYSFQRASPPQGLANLCSLASLIKDVKMAPA